MPILNAGFTVGEDSIIREGTLLYPGVKIGDRFQSGNYAIVRESTTIGNDCSVGSHSEIGHDVTLGNNVRIHSACFIPEYTVLEDDVWLGPRVTICNVFHPLCRLAKECSKKTRVVIKRGSIIGAAVTILPGVEIGEKCLIGAGSVVTKSTIEHGVYIGNPAEMIRGSRESLSCKNRPFADERTHFPYLGDLCLHCMHKE